MPGDQLSTSPIQDVLYHMYQVVSVCIGVPSTFSSVHHVAMASFVELWRKIAADEAKFRRKTGTCESSPEGDLPSYMKVERKTCITRKW